jgi:hypothetical protein
MGLTVSKGLAAENYLEDLDEEEAWEAQETPNLEILPEEIILFIFSFLEASSLGTVGLLNRKLRKISSDELLWKPLFKAKWGVCPIRELLRGQFHWRDEFMQRQAFVHRRRKRMNEDPGTFWSRLSSSLGTWGQRKHKIVFVGLEAAGKTTCCYRLQTSDPEPNIVPSLRTVNKTQTKYLSTLSAIYECRVFSSNGRFPNTRIGMCMLGSRRLQKQFLQQL